MIVCTLQFLETLNQKVFILMAAEKSVYSAEPVAIVYFWPAACNLGATSEFKRLDGKKWLSLEPLNVAGFLD